jgi:hypothetical protein
MIPVYTLTPYVSKIHFNIIPPMKVAAEWLALLLRIQGVPGRSGGQAILTSFSLIFLSPSRQIPGQCLKLGHDHLLL